MIAVSADGAAWSAISLEDAFGTQGSQVVAIAGDRLVVAFSPGIRDDGNRRLRVGPRTAVVVRRHRFVRAIAMRTRAAEGAAGFVD